MGTPIVGTVKERGLEGVCSYKSTMSVLHGKDNSVRITSATTAPAVAHHQVLFAHLGSPNIAWSGRESR